LIYLNTVIFIWILGVSIHRNILRQFPPQSSSVLHNHIPSYHVTEAYRFLSVGTQTGLLVSHHAVRRLGNMKRISHLFWISLKGNQQDVTFSRSLSISSTIAAGSSIGLTIPDAVCTTLCSRWWAEEPHETCRAIYRNKWIEETLHLVGCTLEIYLRCTDIWMSNILHFFCNIRRIVGFTVRPLRPLQIYLIAVKVGLRAMLRFVTTLFFFLLEQQTTKHFPDILIVLSSARFSNESVNTSYRL